MSSNLFQRRSVLISCLLHEFFREKVFFSYAGDFYQKKLVEILQPAKVFSINMGNLPTKSFSEGKNKFHVYRQSARLFFLQTIKFAIDVSKNISKNDIVIFYNITARNMFCFYFLKYFRRIKCFIIVTDYNPPETSVKDKLIHLSLKRSDGILSLSDYLNIHRNTLYSNLLLLPDWDIPRKNELPKVHPNTILLSGMLNESTGLSLAISMMDYLLDYTLFISGILTDLDEEYFKDSIKSKQNITYLGKLSTEKYLQLLGKSEFCLSLRNPRDRANTYNFPSKIGEFLCYRKKVISTISYKNIDRYILNADYNAQSLAESIKKAKSISFEPEDLLEDFGKEAFLSKLNMLIT